MPAFKAPGTLELQGKGGRQPGSSFDFVQMRII